MSENLNKEALLAALQMEDTTISYAGKALGDALTQFEIEVARYAALRDMVSRELGYDPYAKSNIPFTTQGQYRFIRMSTGDAVVAVLKSSETPKTLAQIADTLGSGGLEIQSLAQVNAALLRTAGIKKTVRGYVYEEEERAPPEEAVEAD